VTLERFVAIMRPDWRSAVEKTGIPPVIPVDLDWEAGESGRAFAFFQWEPEVRFAFSPRILDQPEHRQRGIFRHEVGHAVHHYLGRNRLRELLGEELEASDERLADQIAEWLYGDPIRYDGETVQSVSQGHTPRPAWLG
jgi:hypothetical protein